MNELELLAHADVRGRRYTEANGQRRVFPLEEAIALYTKGLELSRSCDALLAAARQTVEMGKMQLEDEINDLE